MNVNAGFLVAIIVGVVAILSLGEGVRAWVDNRIGRAVDPVLARIDAIETRLASDDGRRNQQYGQLRQDICLLTETVGGQCAPGVSPSDAP